MKTNKEDVIKLRDKFLEALRKEESVPSTKWEEANHRAIKFFKTEVKKLDYAIDRWEEKEKSENKR